MCTVSYIPLPGNGFILTSTRDEKTTRKTALPPDKHDINGNHVYFPQDTEAFGTWIASSAEEYSLCLLNGGFENHVSNPPYRRSRGMLMLDFFNYGNVQEFSHNYNFDGIEPFTLLILGYSRQRFDEIRWDGSKLYQTKIDHRAPGIWLSFTLYSDDAIRMRQEWFRQWLLKDPELSSESAIGFHKTAGSDDKSNDILMNRGNIVCTVSITSIYRSRLRHEMHYEDIINKMRVIQNIS